MSEPRRETCQVCERQIRMTRGSRIWSHGDGQFPPGRCRGSGQISKERVALLLKMDQYMHEAREREKWSGSGSR